MRLQILQLIVKNSKCVGLAQEIGFCAPNLCTWLWLVNGATQLCTSKNECNKLDLTAAQYFLLPVVMIGPGGLLLVVPTYMQFQFYRWGCPKNTGKLQAFNFIIQSDILSTGRDALTVVTVRTADCTKSAIQKFLLNVH